MYKLCVSSSVKPFESKAERTWGLERYNWPKDIWKPVVFFGMYHIGDYFHYLRHLGPRIVIWCGHDILNLQRHKRIQRLFQTWTTNYCENRVEQKELEAMEIWADIKPTFLEDINDFPISYKQSNNPTVYMVTRPGRENEYGEGLINRIKARVPGVDFKIYNGTIPEEQFNEEIKNFQCGFRPNFHDGFSEVLAKSVLMAQYPISRIKYPHIDSYETEGELVELLNNLKNKTKPNIEARNYYRKHVNDLPFINR